jgi:hypothetical protein
MDNPKSSTYIGMFYSPIANPSKINEPTTNYIWFIKVNLKEFDEFTINLVDFNE